MTMTGPDQSSHGVSGLTPARRTAVVASLIVSIGLEIGSRALNAYSDTEPLERLMSVGSSALVAVTMVALVRITRQGPTVRRFIVAAIVMIFLSQIMGFTAGVDSLRGAPLIGGGTASNSFLRSLADYGGLVCLVLGFFFMIFDLDDAYRSLERQRELLETQVNKQVEQEAALRRSEERYRNLVEATHVIPWEVDLETWRFNYVGPHAEKMFGYPIDAWYAENFWADHIHPEDRDEAVQFCLAQTAQGLAHDFEYRMLRADGSALWIRDIVSVDRREGAPPKLRGVMIDISEQKAAEAALAAGERRLRFLYDHTPVMMHSIDESGRIVDVNQYWLDVMGYERDEVLGRPSVDFLTPESRRLASEVHLPAYWQTGRIEHVEYQYVRRNGAAFDAVLSAVVADDPDAPNKTSLAFVVDVSERKRIENEQRELRERMEHAQKLESLGVLAGGVAHDFNNLLMAISGNAALALDDAPDGAVGERLREIESNARRGAELCRQMLAYSGKGVLSVTAVDLGGIIRNMGDLLEASHGKKAELRFNLADDMPAVEADPGQIGQIAMNLILNASEAIGDAPGMIVVETAAVNLTAEDLTRFYGAESLQPGRYAALTVRDDGPGMAPGVAARIFEPFYSTKFTGRGLGMAVVLGIVRSHGGAIRVTSAPGQGTEVRVVLPPYDGAPAAAPPPARSNGAAPGGAVLVADDEPSVLDVTRRILEKAGYRVLTAVNGREAVERFDAHRGDIAAVVLDMTMPVMSGSEAALSIRGTASSVPIVLTSGYSADDIRSRANHGPGVGYLQKPYRPQELVALLQSLTTGGS